jgi:hypothetical protein
MRRCNIVIVIRNCNVFQFGGRKGEAVRGCSRSRRGDRSLEFLVEITADITIYNTDALRFA